MYNNASGGGAGLALAYSIIKATDPSSLVVGAVNCDRPWLFSDGQGGESWSPRLALDLSLMENYVSSLPGSDGPGAIGGRPWPGDFDPLVNCLLSGDPNEYGSPQPVDPDRLHALGWADAITTGLVHQMFFEYHSLTPFQIAAAAADLTNELRELTPSFLGAL